MGRHRCVGNCHSVSDERHGKTTLSLAYVWSQFIYVRFRIQDYSCLESSQYGGVQPTKQTVMRSDSDSIQTLFREFLEDSTHAISV